jgi:ABC-type Fe3+-hydroxamate transport system substrate-binding protein
MDSAIKVNFIDQMGRQVNLQSVPKRIISLVPSQSELLCDLGLDEEVVGITKFCIYPEKWHKSKTRIGGTKNPDIEKIKALKPDLIIGNKEENRLEDILELEQIAPVWMSDIVTFDNALEMISTVGDMCGKFNEAQEMVTKLIKDFTTNFPKLKSYNSCVYLIWNEPLMAVGGETFINSMMDLFGVENYYKNKDRYPFIEESKLTEITHVLLSSEPFPFNESHRPEIEKRFPNAKIIFVDGEVFSWYGSRLLLAKEYFEDLKNQFSPTIPR